MLRTAESVSPKHPDKICDQISDAILDAALTQDLAARTAIEVVGGHGLLTITGEISTSAQLDYEAIARKYIDGDMEIRLQITEQSPEIASGVDRGGAGDQGIMIGYATDETEDLIPLEAELARSLNRYIFAEFPYDGKTQITLKGRQIITIVASFQHATANQLQKLIKEWCKMHSLSPPPVVHANPAGNWAIGGFESDAGLTGRKLAVDNYGPRIRIGGGCFSGKDPSKVDRSAAYMARRIAIDYLRARKAKEVYCELAYAIGVAEPIQASVFIDGRETQVKDYDLTPGGISNHLNLKHPQYTQTAQWGHFGNNFQWDK